MMVFLPAAFDFDLCVLISVFRQAPVLYTALPISLGKAGTTGYASGTRAFYFCCGSESDTIGHDYCDCYGLCR
jgi:hypothetical protein